MRYPKKSRSLKRISRKTPGGRTVVHLRQRKNSRPICAECKRFLHGVKQTGSHSEKRVARAYGGFLCSACARQVLIERARRSI